MPNIGLIEVEVDVVEGHVYVIDVDGVTGPVNVHNGPTITDPVIARLRDDRRRLLWEADTTGSHRLLISGWPSQPGPVTVSVREASRRRGPAIAVVAA